jgi:hypothetical protein
MSKPKILLCDIETLPLEVFTWGLFDQNIGLNQVKSDWTVLSWSAKWYGSSKVFYEDVRSEKNIRNDKGILKGIWKLLDEADIVCWHYGSAFDHKKLNARFILNGFSPPSPYRQIDTKKLASKSFGFTSNKLEYLTDKLNKKFKKSGHKKFAGFDMWKECMKGNIAAFNEMRSYNKLDVLSLEELMTALLPWFNPIDMRVFNKTTSPACPSCTSHSVQHRGYNVSNSGKFRRLQCNDCATWFSEKGAKNNLLSKEKRTSLKGKTK